MENLNGHKEDNAKNGNPVGRFFKAFFVHNFLAKFSALVISAAMWALAVGLA